MSFLTIQPQNNTPTSSPEDVFHTPRSQIVRSSPLRERESSTTSESSWGGCSSKPSTPNTRPDENRKVVFSDDDDFPDPIGFSAKPLFDSPNSGPQEFNSEAEVYDYLQEWAKSEGFAIKYGRSEKRAKENFISKRWFDCVCGGRGCKPKVSSPQRVRLNSRSRYTACKWHCVATEKDLVWTARSLSTYHNHPQSFGGTYPVHRRQARQTVPELRRRILTDATVSTISVKDTHSAVQIQFPGVNIHLKDVYNIQANNQLKEDQGLPAIQAMAREMQDFHFHYSIDEHQRLINMVFFEKKCVEFIQHWPSTIILDATYKSNKFNLYLLDIVGITCTGRTFIIGQAFLSSESTEDYQYVLEWLRDIYVHAGVEMPKTITSDKADGLLAALKIVFPTARHLLCKWHINTDVLKYCKRLWRDELVGNVGGESFVIDSDEELPQPAAENISIPASLITPEEKKEYMATKERQFLPMWASVTDASTPEACDEAFAALRRKYIHEYAAVIKYLEKTWMPHKAKFCNAWTSNVSHYGAVTSGRAEAMHRAVKKKIKHRRLHLRQVVKIMKLYVDELNKTILSDIEKDRTALGKLYSKPIYHNLRHRISAFAIGKMNEHLAFFKESHSIALPPCKGTFSRIWGVPCAHQIYAKNEAFERLTVNDFHKQWHLKGTDLPPLDPSLLLRDPVVIRDRVSGKRLKTGRIRSGFETVNSEVDIITASPRKKKQQQRKITDFSWSSQAGLSTKAVSPQGPPTPRSKKDALRKPFYHETPRTRDPTIDEVLDYNRWHQKFNFVAGGYYFYDNVCRIGSDPVAEHDEHGWTDLSKTPAADDDIFDDPEYEEEIYNYFNEFDMTRQEKADLLEDWYAAQAIKSRILPKNPGAYNNWLTRAIVPGVETAAPRHRLSQAEIVQLVAQREQIRLARLRECGLDECGRPLSTQDQEQEDTVAQSIERDPTPSPRKSALKRRREGGSDSEVRETQGAYRGTRSRSRRVQFSDVVNDSDS
jgi:MULE transposase domain